MGIKQGKYTYPGFAKDRSIVGIVWHSSKFEINKMLYINQMRAQ